MVDVTDATFESEVLARSEQVPVVVDLWAPWCGPCKTLGPIIEKVVDETDGAVALVKVDVDQNPRIGGTFRVQSIPAVFALKNRQIVDHFIGALPEPAVREFVDRLLPSANPVDELVAAGDEDSLRSALELQPDHAGAITKLAEILVAKGDADGALALLSKIPETAETRRVAALARVGGADALNADDIDATLERLLDRVKEDEEARRQFVDLLEVLGPEDPRTPRYRRALTSRLF